MFTISFLSPLRKGHGPSFAQITQGCLKVEIGLVILEKILKFYQCIDLIGKGVRPPSE